MSWILIDWRNEAGTGFNGVSAVCEAEDEEERAAADGALGEDIYRGGGGVCAAGNGGAVAGKGCAGERRLYWDSHAAELGYKTARGACVAYHVRRIKAEEASEDARKRSMEALRVWAEEARGRRERRKREREEEMNRPMSEEVMRMIMAAEMRLRERLRLAERYERRRRRTEVFT